MPYSFDGTLMSKDIPLAEFKNNELTVVYNRQLLPIHFAAGHTLYDWLKHRAMDCASRTNARMLRKALQIDDESEVSPAVRVNGATITDTYWLRPLGCSMSYSDIRFSDNPFWQFTLNGPTMQDFDSIFSRTPELTNIGSFEKGWRLHGGSWWLYKREQPENVFSELFACKLGKLLGYNMAEYQFVDAHTVKTLDFTGGATVNYESARDFGLYTDKLPGNYLTILNFAGCKMANAYLQMATLDTLIANQDRHTDNFGFLRETETGRLLGLAPNFDNNLSLLAFEIESPHDGESSLRQLRELLQVAKQNPFTSEITKQQLTEIASDIPCAVNKQIAVDFVFYRYECVQQFIQQLQMPGINP